jgi:WD40 repeat protein
VPVGEDAPAIPPRPWSPDGTHLAIIDTPLNLAARSISIWDVGHSQPRLALHTSNLLLYSLAWAPDGTRIAAGAQGRVCIWDAGTGEHVRTIQQPDIGRTAVAWSPDGGFFVTRNHNATRLHLWETATGQQRSSFVVSFGPRMVWSPDSSYLACGGGLHNLIEVWNPF